MLVNLITCNVCKRDIEKEEDYAVDGNLHVCTECQARVALTAMDVSGMMTLDDFWEFVLADIKREKASQERIARGLGALEKACKGPRSVDERWKELEDEVEDLKGPTHYVDEDGERRPLVDINAVEIHDLRPKMSGMFAALKELREDVDGVRNVHKELRRDLDALDTTKERAESVVESLGVLMSRLDRIDGQLHGHAEWATGAFKELDDRVGEAYKRLAGIQSTADAAKAATARHDSAFNGVDENINDLQAVTNGHLGRLCDVEKVVATHTDEITGLARLVDATRGQVSMVDGLAHSIQKTVNDHVVRIRELDDRQSRLRARVKSLDNPNDVREAVERVFSMENEVDRLENIDVEGLEEAQNVLTRLKKDFEEFRKVIITIIEAEEHAMVALEETGARPGQINKTREMLRKQREHFQKRQED